jgi:hypothetical protein
VAPVDYLRLKRLPFRESFLFKRAKEIKDEINNDRSRTPRQNYSKSFY